jgi:hypothetical protein
VTTPNFERQPDQDVHFQQAREVHRRTLVHGAGLYISLWTAGALGWRPPGLTARLEVDYKKRLSSDTLIVCTVELEEIDHRKVWMKAHVLDGNSGEECARARALFVAPRWSKIMKGLLPFLKG